jgi:hypothetical protein
MLLVLALMLALMATPAFASGPPSAVYGPNAHACQTPADDNNQTALGPVHLYCTLPAGPHGPVQD